MTEFQISPISGARLSVELGERMDRMIRLLLRGVEQRVSRTGTSVLGRLRDGGPRRISELAALERVSQPSMTVLVSRLEESGLAERLPDPDDGRAVLVAVTGEGLALLRSISAGRAAILAERIDRLDADERERLEAVLPLLDSILAPPGPMDGDSS